MTRAFWLDDFTTLDLQTEDQTQTSTPIAGIQNVELVPNVTIDQLRTADKIKIEEQKQHEALVNVNIGYSKWSNEVLEQWLGGAGSSATSWTDTSDPQKYEIDANFVSVGGDYELDVTVTGITFEEMPMIAASRGEFVQWDLEGTGEDISNYTFTDNTA